MRVHRLEVTAFGPFCETQVVDFDLLNEAGVFLLTGDTGAGKTSILDAICFGLYGQVPGMRDKAKAYRSHHAAADVPPRVVLEVTLRGRRLRLTRQAPWLRPSRRARKGYVDEPARALAEERRHGQWVTVSTRVDEVGHLVSTWLGLNRDQFCQVVMLPQGDFQAFLRSGARERQSILETLFGTQRFQAVERWLAEHRRQQARTCRDLEAQGSRLLARLSEACSPPIVGLPVEPAALAVDAATFMSDVRQIVETAGVEMRSARLASDAAETLAKERVHALDSARAVAERREKYREAQRQHAALLAMHEVTTAREIRLRRARLAAPLYPHVALTREADEAAARADADAAALLDDWDLARDEWGIEGDVPTSPAQAGGVVASLRERLARLAELASDALEIESLADRVRVESERRFALAASIAANRERLLATPARRAELQTLLARAAATVQSGPDAAVRHAEGLRILAAAEEAESHSARLGELDTALLAAREAAVTVTEQWLDARTRLLAGVAAELAAGLVDGEGCPVCGSSLHPEPAQPLAQHVSAEEENALLHRVESLRAVVSRSETARSAIVSAHTDAMIRSRGLDVAAAQALVAVAEAEQAEATAAVPERDSLQAAIESLVKADETQRHAVEEATADLARAEERITEWSRRRQQLSDRVTAVVGDVARLPAAMGATQAHLDRATAVEKALRSRDEAHRDQRRARQRLAAALEPTDFVDVVDVAAAVLAPAELSNEEALARAHDLALATWSRLLADPALVAAAAEAEPDLASLTDRARTAEKAALAAHSHAAAVERRQARLDELAEELTALRRVLRPAQEARDLAEQVAGLCAGTSAENLTRTALSHFVLAARLAQVVEAANSRLDGIAGGRYQLEHTMGKGAGDTRGGLGLVVRDTHTDQSRDPATLSGGETFYVSLSLALGLADVVTTEAGGVELSTLFVDEGFGTLDRDTCDEVLDELDALRSGGRVVGLVSHLSELRARCPVQLHVASTARGSHCRPVQTGAAEPARGC